MSQVAWNALDGDSLLSIEDVAKLLNIPVDTVRKQRVENKFCPGYRLGKHVRWRMSELTEWLESKRDPE